MTQLKEIRTRIASITNTKQVTSAMKMVSAAKLKKAQDMIMQMALYDQKTYEILGHLMQGKSECFADYTRETEAENVLIVVVGSNRGLCGGFNANVAKACIQHVLSNYSDALAEGKVSFMALGKQAERELVSRGAEMFETAHYLTEQQCINGTANFVAKLTDWYLTDKFQKIVVVFNRFKNAAVQVLTVEQFLPLTIPESSVDNGTIPNYIFEPSEEEIVNLFVPKALKLHMYRILLDSIAAEHGARMTAMYQATENATEMLKELKNSYNNARQTAITNEIMEILGGAEALRSR